MCSKNIMNFRNEVFFLLRDEGIIYRVLGYTDFVTHLID